MKETFSPNIHIIKPALIGKLLWTYTMSNSSSNFVPLVMITNIMSKLLLRHIEIEFVWQSHGKIFSMFPIIDDWLNHRERPAEVISLFSLDIYSLFTKVMWSMSTPNHSFHCGSAEILSNTHSYGMPMGTIHGIRQGWFHSVGKSDHWNQGCECPAEMLR